MSLARWAASRSFSPLRWNAFKSTSRRPFLYLPPQFYPGRAHLSTCSARIWYRKNGTPRSKVKGLLIGSVSVLFTGLFFAAGEVMKELEDDNSTLRQLVHIQRADTELSSLDLNDLVVVTDYFLSVCCLCSEERVPADVFDAFLAAANSLTGEKREEFHTVLREAVEKVHRTLINSKGQDPLRTASDVVDCLSEAFQWALNFISLEIQDVIMVKTHFQDMTSKVQPPKGDEYEVVE